MSEVREIDSRVTSSPRREFGRPFSADAKFSYPKDCAGEDQACMRYD